MAFVFLLVGVALYLFASEIVRVDVAAIGIMVALLLVEPVTQTFADAGLLAEPIVVLRDAAAEDAADAIRRGLSGFSSTATITVLAMFILSEGVRRTGVIQRLGTLVQRFTRDDETRQLGATIGLVGPISGFVNNTAAVAILLPMVTDLAHESRTSPSKLLIPLSYASMFGGMLTLIGTSTNILASQLSADLIGRPFSMFEFTQLGIVVTVVGTIYLMTVGRRLVPARIKPDTDLTDEFEMVDYLTEVVVREDSPLVGEPIGRALAGSEVDVDVLQLIRGDRTFLEPFADREVRPGDIFALRTDRETLVELLDVEGLDMLPVEVADAELETAEEEHNLVEVIVAPGSYLVGESLESANFRQRYDASVLAIRRGHELFRERMDRVRLRVGDTLLIQGPAQSLDRLNNNPDFIVAQAVERPDYRESKTGIAVGIVAAVVLLAAATPIHIVTAALGGALGMAVTGCLKAHELYDAVQWDVIILLAGVIPLGVALEQTGGAALIAEGLIAAAPSLPPIVALGLLYLLTALLTNVISNNASIVLMVPVAVEAAVAIGADPFSFILATTFAASTAFMTPVGYQTNLFVYGPGGYRFTDFIRAGGPLQAVFAVVTTVGIWFFWGV